MDAPGVLTLADVQCLLGPSKHFTSVGLKYSSRDFSTLNPKPLNPLNPKPSCESPPREKQPEAVLNEPRPLSRRRHPPGSNGEDDEDEDEDEDKEADEDEDEEEDEEEVRGSGSCRDSGVHCDELSRQDLYPHAEIRLLSLMVSSAIDTLGAA